VENRGKKQSSIVGNPLTRFQSRLASTKNVLYPTLVSKARNKQLTVTKEKKKIMAWSLVDGCERRSRDK
jgi:hypothetical protein